MNIYTLNLYVAIAAAVITFILSIFRKPSNWLVEYVKNFVGAFFIFSGFIKIVDPLGTSYKIGEYFVEFGGVFKQLESYSLFFGNVMLIAEVVLGIMLIIGALPRLTTWLLLLIIIAFTFLTGYTAITNKVTDCGCFGDFLKLKPLFSFYKDIFLSILIIYLFIKWRDITEIFNYRTRSLISLASLFFFIWFSERNYRFNLPPIDFRPFAEGVNIKTAKAEANKDVPIVESVFIYENEETKAIKTFDLKNLPKAPWKYKDRKDNILHEGSKSKIKEFEIIDDSGNDITDSILSMPKAWMITAWSLENTDIDAWKNHIIPLSKYATAHNIPFFVLTSDSNWDIFANKIGLQCTFSVADPLVLKTIVRANPALTLLKNGTIVKHFHHKNLPSAAVLEAL
jgi:uncharacterized membrane protein YphA (DoxX/SURF4 family)